MIRREEDACVNSVKTPEFTVMLNELFLDWCSSYVQSASVQSTVVLLIVDSVTNNSTAGFLKDKMTELTLGKT